MKKGMKIFSCLCSGVLMLSIISGCEKPLSSGTGNATVVTVQSANMHSQVVMMELINTYNKTIGKKKGIWINYQVSNNGMITDVADLRKIDAPDFFWGIAWEAIQSGDAMAIDDLPGGTEFLNHYEGEKMLERNQYYGKTYAVPTAATTSGLIYNKDLFKAAGIVDENGEAKPPRTYQELRECAKKLTNPGKNQFGIIFPMKWDDWFSSDMIVPMMSIQGFEEYNPKTGKMEYQNYQEPLETFMGIINDGSMYPGAEELDNDSARALFADGKVGMKFGFSFDVGVLNDQFPAVCDWGVVPYPVLDPDAPRYAQRMEINTTPYINANSKVPPEKLLEVVKFFASDQMIRDCYRNGVELPYRWDIVSDVFLGEQAKIGWQEFAEIVNISALYPNSPQKDYSGLKKPSQIFLEDIYTGKLSVAEGITEMEKNANQAIENYYAAHPEASMPIPDPDWNPVLQYKTP